MDPFIWKWVFIIIRFFVFFSLIVALLYVPLHKASSIIAGSLINKWCLFSWHELRSPAARLSLIRGQ